MGEGGQIMEGGNKILEEGEKYGRCRRDYSLIVEGTKYWMKCRLADRMQEFEETLRR